MMILAAWHVSLLADIPDRDLWTAITSSQDSVTVVSSSASLEQDLKNIKM